MSTLGTIFLIYYIFRGSTDVVASDYIRIINYYLEDVSDLHYLLSWEGIARIPFTFLMRFLNVKIFSYSVFFDKIIGTFGLFLFNMVILSFVLKYLHSKPIRMIASFLITYISFSLMAWEMILNGTGYAHFLMVGLTALTLKMFANIEGISINANENYDIDANVKLKKHLQLSLLIIITSLCFAGSYSVSYLCTIIFFSIVSIIVRLHKKEKFLSQIVYIVISLVCLSLYFKSNNTGEALIPVGFKDISLIQLLKTQPLFPIKFMLKSLASSIIGVETFDYALKFGTINEKFIFLIGFIYLIIIIFVIVLLIIKIINVVRIVYCKNDVDGANVTKQNESEVIINEELSLFIFISMFIVAGIANYLLVFLARYKFVVDSYGMTSRYSLQYMFLTIGIIMLLLKLMDELLTKHLQNDEKVVQIQNGNETKKKVFLLAFNNKIKTFLIVSSIMSLSFITIGHLTTNTDEIFKADYRKIIYSIVEDKAKNYKNLTDQDLEDTFEYHRGLEQIRKAFEILENQKLNIFREYQKNNN